MIIERLDLKAFGRFTDVSLDLSAGPHRFHIVYGPNESGKSTSLRAITSLLYGMPDRSADNFVHDYRLMRVGGRLVDDQGNVLDCLRRRGRKDTLRDQSDREVIADSRMAEMLSGVNRETFEHRFGLSHDELVRGGAQIIEGDGDLGSILFAAGAGVSRLREIQTELDSRCAKLFIPRGKNGTVNQAIRTLTDRKKELREAQVPPADFEHRKLRLQQQRLDAQRTEQQIKQASIDLSRLQAMEKALPSIPQWESTNAQLAKVADTPLLDDAFTDRRRSLETDREVAVSKQRDLAEKLEQLQTQFAALAKDSAVMANESEIEHLFKKLGAREEARENSIELQRKRANLDRRMTELLSELQFDFTGNDGEVSEKIDLAVENLRVGDAVRTRVHELARKYELLIGQRDAAAEEIEAITYKIADLEQQLSEAAEVDAPDALSELIDSIGSPDTLLESLNGQRADADRAKRACDSIHRRLTGIKLSVTQTAKLQMPSASTVLQLTDRMSDASHATAVAKAKHESLLAQRDEVNRRITSQEIGRPLPTLRELDDARIQRDSLLAKLLDAGKIDGASLLDLRQSILAADQIGDTIRLHHEQVHRRSIDIATLETLNQDIDQVQEEIAASTSSLGSAQLEWRSMWELIGVVCDTPQRMQQWVSDHEQLVQRVDQWEEERRRLHETQRRIQSACARLRSAVGSVAFAKAGVADSDLLGNDRSADESVSGSLFSQEDSQVDLIELHEDALALRRKLADAKRKRSELEAKLAELKQALPEARSRLQSRQKHVDSWQRDWDSATESFAKNTAGHTDRTPTVVVEMVTQINDLCNQKRERDILAKRIQSIADDEESYRKKVLAMSANVGLSSAQDRTSADGRESDTHELVRILFQRLQAERAVMASCAALGQQIQETQAQLSQAAEQQMQCDVSLGQLCGEAKCDDFKALIDIERQSRQRRELESTRDALQQQLRLLAGHDNIDDFVFKAGQQELGVLQIEIQQSQRALDELNERLAQSQRDVGALSHELDQIDGGHRAAELNQSIQLLAGDLYRDAEEYARLKIAAMILRQSIDHYRNENQGPVLKYAQDIFRVLTCGQYHGLRVDYDGKDKLTLLGVRSEQDPEGVPAVVMSTGTADALYLALRLASLRHQLSHGTRIPLVVDDCLVQLDDSRAAAALSALSTLSTQTQVILFTHHQHLLDLAEQSLGAGEFHIHRLSC